MGAVPALALHPTQHMSEYHMPLLLVWPSLPLVEPRLPERLLAPEQAPELDRP
jgi:hypothetical protein